MTWGWVVEDEGSPKQKPPFTKSRSGDYSPVGSHRGHTDVGQMRNQGVSTNASRFRLTDGTRVRVRQNGSQVRIRVDTSPPNYPQCDAQVWCEKARTYYDEPYILRSTDGLWSWYVWSIKEILFTRGVPWGGSCKLEFIHIKDDPTWEQGRE